MGHHQSKIELTISRLKTAIDIPGIGLLPLWINFEKSKMDTLFFGLVFIF